MTNLFRRDKSVISRHLRNIFATRELDRKSVVACSDIDSKRARGTGSALAADKIEDGFLKVIRLQEYLLEDPEYLTFSRVSIAVAE